MASLTQAETVSGSGRHAAAGSLLAAVFFVSGMPALIYQLLWQRALFTMFGINIEAVTVVVAGFLMGLGFGSVVGGRISRRRSLNLLVVFGAIELVVWAVPALSAMGWLAFAVAPVADMVQMPGGMVA